MHRDADALEMLGLADAGQLQDVRRADRAGGQMISAAASTRWIVPPREYSTPTARVPSNRTRCTSALITTCRLGRFIAGRR